MLDIIAEQPVSAFDYMPSEAYTTIRDQVWVRAYKKNKPIPLYWNGAHYGNVVSAVLSDDGTILKVRFLINEALTEADLINNLAPKAFHQKCLSVPVKLTPKFITRWTLLRVVSFTLEFIEPQVQELAWPWQKKDAPN